MAGQAWMDTPKIQPSQISVQTKSRTFMPFSLHKSFIETGDLGTCFKFKTWIS